MSLISVNNLTITKTSVVANLKIEISELILFKSCTFRTLLFDIDNNIIDTKFYTIDGDDYQNWNNDDYIVEWIKKQL